MDDWITTLPSLADVKARWDSIAWIVEALTAVVGILTLIVGTWKFLRRTALPQTSFGFHFARIKTYLQRLQDIDKAGSHFNDRPDRIAGYAGACTLRAITMLTVLCFFGLVITDPMIRAAVCAAVLGLILGWFSKPVMVLTYLSNPRKFRKQTITAIRDATDKLVATGHQHKDFEAIRPLLDDLKQHMDGLDDDLARRPEPGDY